MDSFRKIYIFKLLILIGIVSCKTSIQRISIEQILNRKIQDPMIESKSISVYIITNRYSKGTPGCTNQYFQNHPSSVQYVICDVNVPVHHSIGSLNFPDAQILDENTDFFPIRFQFKDKNSFFQSLSHQKEILLFVHGFNVEFQEALFRASQIKYDLKFQGTVILYTWPAGPQKGLLSNLLINETYRTNQKYAKVSIPVFKNFLFHLLNILDSDAKIYVIVHSMGHQIVIPAMIQLSDILRNQRIREVIFHAPDYPLEKFKQEVKILKQLARRITLYCSPEDNALKVSKAVNGNFRLGQCSRIDGVDVINVSRIDSPLLGVGGLGHGYYSSRAILTDLYQLLLGVQVEKRLYIAKSQKSTEHYILRD